jgi:hypothetical protein
VLARLEKIDGVLDAWTDKTGSRIVIAHVASADVGDLIALVSSELAPRSRARLVEGKDAEEAIRGAQKGDGWYRSKETRALSREEAGILASRAAKRAAKRADLDADETARLEGLVKEALDGVFSSEEKKARFDGNRLEERIKKVLEWAADEMKLPGDRTEKLKAALTEE